jgi:hypothetical protein
MQIEKPATTNEKNLTTNVNLGFINENFVGSGRSASTVHCSNLESERNIGYKPRVS